MMDSLNFPEIRRAGSAALMLDCGDLDSSVRLLRILKAARDSGAVDIAEFVPAAQTVMVRGRDAKRSDRFAAQLKDILSHASSDGSLAEDVEEVWVPVIYDGGDLDEVAKLTGLSPANVISRHTAAHYNVAFTGFAPGFAYLSGGDPALVVPRRATPRPRIPAGSVGLAGAFSGVYPRESPGGWQLLGHTEFAMWDLERENPALLQPGASVRFEVTRERVHAVPPNPAGSSDEEEKALNPAASGAQRRGIQDADSEPAALTIHNAGLQTLIVDRGRPGLASLGVSVSGAADRGALERANWAVGNAGGAAALELSHGGFQAVAHREIVVAVAGAPRAIAVEGSLGVRTVPMEVAFRVNPGELLGIGAPTAGLRSVVALRGGVLAAEILGSSSRDTLAGLGPEPLRVGDEVRLAHRAVQAVAEVPPPPFEMPRSGGVTVLDIILGPRDNWFSSDSHELLQRQTWDVSMLSDRVGVRLTGQQLTRTPEFAAQELPSEGMVAGSIQVPPDGQPVVFLADHPLTGGYPVIAVLHERHLDVAAQLPPGARIQFRAVESSGRSVGHDRDAKAIQPTNQESH